MDSAYQLRFPCPECNGTLTMCRQQGIGQCPLCHCVIEARLNLKSTPKKTHDEPKLGWDRRAFRRPTATTKPIWQSVPESSE